MADNYLERQYEDFLAHKAAEERRKKAAWRKRLEEYKKKLKTQEKAHNETEENA